MIIVSQDKEEIVNFNNIENIWINTEDGIRYAIEATGSMTTILGVYETEERAKEVLTEIMCKFSIFDIGTSVEFADLIYKEKQLAVYEMPEE